MNNENNPLEQLNIEAKKIEKGTPLTNIVFNFCAKAFLAYLPLIFYYIVNTTDFKESTFIEEQNFLKGLFLALSYVFIAQVNILSVKKDSVGNFLYSIKILCGICCIALSVTNRFNLYYILFFFFLFVSLVTLFFSNKPDKVDIGKIGTKELD